MNKYTVSCIGVGMRGNTYLSLMNKLVDKYEIVSLCDLDAEKLEMYSKEYGVETNNCFLDENKFFSKKRSDLLVISTLDKDHVGHLIKALEAGYTNILVEKPFCTTFEEINRVIEAKKKHPANIYVCHVLRYAPAFLKAKEWIDEGKIGKLICMQATERVGYMHQAHSYVRGHYSNSETSSPMIMAKSCHDLDLLVWYANSMCDSISSYGSLNYFKKENQPEGASHRCKDCKYRGTGKCNYDVYDVYFKKLLWARPWVTNVRPVTDEAVLKGLDEGPYGRCAFDCGNDVVDNQIVNMQFKNGVTASFLMTAFTPYGGRRIVFEGVEGEIILDETYGSISLITQKEGKKDFEISSLVDAAAGHGGGDQGLVNELYNLLEGTSSASSSSLELSLESHKMALYAEDSRVNGGKLIKL